MTTTPATVPTIQRNEAADIASDLRQRGYGSKRAALHLRYDTMGDLALRMLLDTEDLPADARSVIGEIVTQREGEEAEISGELMSRFDRDEPATPTTYRLDTTVLTVFAIGQYGQEHDLNAEGKPCKSLADLRGFVLMLASEGLETGLLAEIEEELALHLEREDEETYRAKAREDEIARQNDLWDVAAEKMYQDELRRTRAS